MYSALGEGDATDFFYVDPDTGRVTIKELLYPGTDREYTVSSHWLDLI